MQFWIPLISFLLMLTVIIEARDKDIDDEAFETEKVGYCPRKEEFWRCGTGCERSCTHPELIKKCPRKCIPNLCTCKRGYYRDNQGSGRCVRRKLCKKW